MVEIVGGFPVIEDLIAVLYRSVRCSQYVDRGEDAKNGGRGQAKVIRGRCISLWFIAVGYCFSVPLLPGSDYFPVWSNGHWECTSIFALVEMLTGAGVLRQQLADFRVHAKLACICAKT